MTSHVRAVLAILFIMLIPPSLRAEENEAFSWGHLGTKPVLWEDYQPLQENVGTCLKDNRLETKTCKDVQERVARAMSDALLQAVFVNVGNPPNDKFCDDYTRKLVLTKEIGPMAAYAMLLVDERLKYGSGLYPSLPETYLGKIVFDALVAQSPCHE